MEAILLNINYSGAIVEIQTTAEESLMGTIYPIEMNGNYCFTVFLNEEDEWTIMREQDATVPFIEPELFTKIIKKLQYELRYAA